MLPLLKPEKKGISITAIKLPEGSDAAEESKENPALMAAAEGLIAAIHSKDPKAVATALEAAFMECDNDEEDEGAESMCDGGLT